MPAQWLSSSSDIQARVGQWLEPLVDGLSQPAQQRRMRAVLLALFALWAVLALARMVWALLPQPEQAGPPPAVINPVSSSGVVARSGEMDIQRMQGWHLFGEAGAAAPAPVPQPVATSSRDGIEKGARETRLNLKLRGIVASTEDGLGHAIIEHRSKQAVYAVEDKLPVSGRVRLAKVMPRQVILDNGGTYERLELFEKSELEALPPARGQRTETPRGTGAAIDKRNEAETAALAADYRSRLFDNPASLAEVVNVSAVRQDGGLQGYRVTPGRDADQFEQLGFEPGDLVTSVNGIALDSPANTMKLYNAMRTAREVVFELKRADQELTLSVSLDGGGQ